jgi:hypothetical protein
MSAGLLWQVKNGDEAGRWRNIAVSRFDRDNLPRGSPISAHFPGSSTSRCALAASTAFALKGSVKVVPSYHDFH